MNQQGGFSFAMLRSIGSTMAYYPNIAIAIKDVSATIYLCNFLFSENREADEEGWSYKSEQQIFKETGLNDKVQKHCRTYLKKIGILEECRKVIDGEDTKEKSLHSRFDWHKLEELIKQK